MTSVQPVQDLNYWRDILHNAARIAPNHPDYADAQATIPYAKAMIQHANRSENADEWTRGFGDPYVNPVSAAGAGLAHGMSLGTGEPISGLASMVTGGSFREGAQQYREGLSVAEGQNPTLTATGETVGPLALPAGTVGPAISTAVKAGVPLTARTGAALLARGAAAGAVPAGIAGFSAGGEDPGDIPARLEAAKHSAEIGAILGTLGTAAGIHLTRGHVERAADLTDKGVQRAEHATRLATSQARLAKLQEPADAILPGGLRESAVRQQLADLQIPQEQINAQIAKLRGGGTPSAVAPTVPVDQTPAPKPPIDPLDNPTFQRRAPPEGRTFPYYPRGGQAEQATSPGPVSSMPPIPTKIIDASRPLAAALGQVPESFEGGGFSGVAQALQHPAYQNAEILAGQAVRLGMPQFKGMSLPDATAALRTMIVQHVERGGEIPPITTVPKFLERLSLEGAVPR